MIGKHIGLWEVLEEVRVNNRKYYRCRCECGTIRNVCADSLRRQRTLSCGCLQREIQMDKAVDLTGKTFGRLYVIEKDMSLAHRNSHWICRCDCGTIKSIRGSYLLCGDAKSCGCLHTETLVRNGRKTIVDNSVEQMHDNKEFNTQFQVIENPNPPKNNTSGCKGVGWDKKRQCWQAYIQVNKKHMNLGRYRKFEDAVAARLAAEKKYFKPLIEQKNATKGR